MALDGVAGARDVVAQMRPVGTAPVPIVALTPLQREAALELSRHGAGLTLEELTRRSRRTRHGSRLHQALLSLRARGLVRWNDRGAWILTPLGTEVVR